MSLSGSCPSGMRSLCHGTSHGCSLSPRVGRKNWARFVFPLCRNPESLTVHSKPAVCLKACGGAHRHSSVVITETVNSESVKEFLTMASRFSLRRPLTRLVRRLNSKMLQRRQRWFGLFRRSFSLGIFQQQSLLESLRRLLDASGAIGEPRLFLLQLATPVRTDGVP